MPITNELKSINRLEEAGFSHTQAKAVVEVMEEGLQRGFDLFVEVLDRKLGGFEARMRLEFQSLRTEIQEVRTEIQATKAELMKEQRDQMLRFVALVSLVVAVIGTVVGFAVKRF